ncbi:MAG: PadR family transcriptional regulator [Marmoricola sp.]
MARQDLPVTSYAVLGLLALGGNDAKALTGYELKQRADNTMRYYWTAPAMSQVYTELSRLTDLGLVDAVTGTERPSTSYTISGEGRAALRTWLDDRSVGFPVFKHPVALRLMVGDLTDAATTRSMLQDYLGELALRRADLRAVRRSLAGSDAPGEAFHHPSLVADWGLAHFASEERITRRILGRLAAEG